MDGKTAGMGRSRGEAVSTGPAWSRILLSHSSNRPCTQALTKVQTSDSCQYDVVREARLSRCEMMSLEHVICCDEIRREGGSARVFFTKKS